MTTATKEMKFEAAHRLVQGYPGKCKNNHGHSWVVFVTVESSTLDKYGFVKDFGDFKPLREWIDEKLDHATIVSDSDVEFQKWLTDNNQRYYVVAHNPTSEVLSRIIYEKAQELLEDEHCHVTEVRIKETCTSECSYTTPSKASSW